MILPIKKDISEYYNNKILQKYIRKNFFAHHKHS